MLPNKEILLESCSYIIKTLCSWQLLKVLFVIVSAIFMFVALIIGPFILSIVFLWKIKESDRDSDCDLMLITFGKKLIKVKFSTLTLELFMPIARHELSILSNLNVENLMYNELWGLSCIIMC